MIIPTITEGELLDAIAAEYERTRQQPGDVTATMLMKRLSIGYEAAQGVIDKIIEDNPGRFVKLRVLGSNGKTTEALRECK